MMQAGVHPGLKDHVKIPGQCKLLPSPYLILLIPDLVSSFRPAVLFSLSMTLIDPLRCGGQRRPKRRQY